jgi:MFS family permease
MMNGKPVPRLFSFEFLSLCLILVAAFCNVSVFYSFYHYLGLIGIPVVWRGLLVGLEPMAAFGLRLFVLPWLHARNAYSLAMVSLVLLTVISWGYLPVASISGLIALRVAHGAVFVLLTSSVISLMVHFIPADRSGQGFSALSIATIIPYALIPPLTEYLLPHVRNEAHIYAGVSVFSVAGLFLMIALQGRIIAAMGRMDAVLMHRPTLLEIRENFSRGAIVLLLVSMLFIYLAHATLFYFMKNLSLQMQVGNVGVFFTVSMITTISVRIFGAAILDRFNKTRLAAMVLCLLFLCFMVLPHTTTPLMYYLLAALYGASIGMAIPILNALLFSVSTPALRGLNTNMTLFAMDAGYFLTPYLGGVLIAYGAGFGALFCLAGLYFLAGLFLVLVFAARRNEGQDDEGTG